MKWKIGLIIVGFSGMVALLAVSRDEITDALTLLLNVNLKLLLIVPLIQLFSFYANAQYYRHFLKSFHYDLSLSELYKLSIALNFVNQIFPSGGVSSATFISYGLRSSVPAGKAALAQAGRYIMTYVSYTSLLAVGVLWLYFGGSMDRIVVRVVVLLAFAGVAISLVFLFILRSNSRFDNLVFRVQQLIDWIGFKLNKKRRFIGKDRAETLLREFHDGYEYLRKERKNLRKPLLYAFLGNVAEVIALYITFIALGQLVNPGAVIIGYAAANAAGATSVIPGDLGIFEIAMVAALSATGLALALGLSASLLHRVTHKLLFLAPGFIFYTHIVRGNKNGRSRP